MLAHLVRDPIISRRSPLLAPLPKDMDVETYIAVGYSASFDFNVSC